MKRLFVRQCLGLAVGLGLVAGCAKPAAQTDQPRAVIAPTEPSAPAVVLPPMTPTSLAQTDTPQAAPPAAATAPAASSSNAPAALAGVPVGGDTNAMATNAPVIAQRIAPAQPENMSPGIDEIARLAQGGVSEEVILAYIQKYPGKFNATADQIVYLNDLGISSAVVTEMLKHDGADAPPPTQETAPAQAAQPQQQVSNVPQGVPGGVPMAGAPAGSMEASAPSAQVATPPSVPAPSTDVAYFYDSLSPYGSWMYVSGYGWCWQPTVAVSVSGWRPYGHSGRWYWSDSGWYWHSDYSWGWAPFHYGRWYMHPHSGWLWMPGTVWGPSWVSWRYSDGYCGWAPLPPEAYWVSGVGFTYYGSHAAVGFDFGLSWYHYAYVPIGHFHDHHHHHHYVPHHQLPNVHRGTRVANYYTPNRGGIVNRGVGRETIARHTQGGDVRQVRIESAGRPGMAGPINRLDRRGRETIAYRPELPKDPPVRPAVVQSRMAQDARQQQRIARADTGPGIVNTTPRAGRSSLTDRDGRASVTPRAETAAPDRVRPGRDSVVAPSRSDRPGASGSQEPRVTAPRQSEPRTTAPSRAEPRQAAPERSAPNRIDRAPRSAAPAAQEPRSVARNNETPAAARSAPAARVAPVAPRSTPLPQNNAANNAPRPVYTAPRPSAPATVTPPATTRPSQPSASPRAIERSPVYAAPRPSAPAPSYAAPRVAPSTPSYSAPRVAPSAPSQPAPSYNAPRGGGGAVAAPRTERGGGGGGGNVSRGDVAGGRGNRER